MHPTTSPQPPHRLNKDTMPLIQEPPVEAQDDTAEAGERAARIRIKNRRKLYLDRHPSYFTSPDLELSGASIVPHRLKGRLTYARSIAL